MPPTSLYEFRIPYCGCDTCNLVTGDFAECSSYETYGKSVTVEVVAPIDLAPFTGMEQVAVGFIWYEVVDFLQQALDKVNAVRVRGGPCARIAVCEMTRPPLRATVGPQRRLLYGTRGQRADLCACARPSESADHARAGT